MLTVTVNSIRRTYLYASLFTLTGWVWLFLSITNTVSSSFTPCIFRNLTHYPCPSCGTTTSLIHILSGEFDRALGSNPLGFLAGAGLLILPLWLGFDILQRRVTFYKSIIYFNGFIKRQPIFIISFLLLIVVNWIWLLLIHIQ